MIDLTADYPWASQRIPQAISTMLQATGSLERLLRRTGWSPETRDRLTMLEGAGNALLCMARSCTTAPDAPDTEQAATVRLIGLVGMWCESLAELEPILLAESKAAAWIARHTASDGQAARWRECGFAPSARVEWVCEGVRITGTVTADGRVALDEPVHGESHLRLTSAWRTVVA